PPRARPPRAGARAPATDTRARRPRWILGIFLAAHRQGLRRRGLFLDRGPRNRSARARSTPAGDAAIADSVWSAAIVGREACELIQRVGRLAVVNLFCGSVAV